MEYRMISVYDLKNYIGRPDILIIDLREKEDYEKGHIFGAVWADWEQLENQIEILLQREESGKQWIILYCERGNTSLLAARDLARLGYPVMSVNGGYLRWQHANT